MKLISEYNCWWSVLSDGGEERIHPQSMQELRRLVKLHGARRVLWSVGLIEIQLENEAKAKPVKPKVVIEVSGGIADVTSCPDGVDVEIIDHDNLEEEAS